MTLEHVTFAKIENTKIDKKQISKLKPENVAEPIKKQAAPLTNKGFNPNATPLMSDEQKARIAAQSSSINTNKSILFTAGGFGR